jgi:hypothetical protein
MIGQEWIDILGAQGSEAAFSTCDVGGAPLTLKCGSCRRVRCVFVLCTRVRHAVLLEWLGTFSLLDLPTMVHHVFVVEIWLPLHLFVTAAPSSSNSNDQFFIRTFVRTILSGSL